MTKLLVLLLILVSGMCFAQEEMIMPSSFDENKMILKRKDENGNFVPVDENIPVVEDSGSGIRPPFMPQKRKDRIITKKFRKKQREYSMPKSTMDIEVDRRALPSTFFTGKTIVVPEDNTPSIPMMKYTMEDARKELERESTIFEECNSNDKNCREYEVDNQGKVKF